MPLERLREYLRPVLGEAAGSLEARQFPGGHSNLTYLLRSGAEQWVLRRPPFGSKVKSAHDMSREYRILTALKDVFSYGPAPAHFCGDHDIIGCDFYLMNYIRGLVIRREYPSGLNLSPDQVRRQLFNFFDVLGDLHSVDLAQAGLFSGQFRPPGRLCAAPGGRLVPALGGRGNRRHGQLRQDHAVATR